ncbi:hypothetical protein DQM68_05920 [Leptospira mayottensis]|uniref:Uncharacterized protein n=2 Tax=Leptospira mayottensis TaxID=1137606 RepID=A0AA87MT06_9LEPT|nr:hypothetical protein DQM68_05920 [Leptospira mayottensis]AZQ03884.1 hypothetical protein LEP1GSC190_15760 [Leptospira mayottensis 200901116]EKS01410.1 hypothetical protein LEP1GSC125_0029 [Leptospira mayottensis 200901122]AXR66076.1 hypothetical protein DQM28_07430 [Leptospira mayottensis]AXR66078.1 hypothetical protein DQM28_07510 [Leptospira mayottensis]
MRLVNSKSSTTEEEKLFQKRIEGFWNRFEKLSSTKKREEVKKLISLLTQYEKKVQTMILEWKNHFEKEREIRRKLRVIGERMGGKRKI